MYIRKQSRFISVYTVWRSGNNNIGVYETRWLSLVVDTRQKMCAITLNFQGNNHNSKHCTPSPVFLSSGQFLLPYRRATFQFFSIKLGASPCVPTTAATSRLLFGKHIYKMLFTRPRRRSSVTDILLRICKVYFPIEQKTALGQLLLNCHLSSQCCFLIT